MDLALNNLERLICHKTQPNKQAILDALEKIPSVQLQKLVDSMPSQIFEVIKANSGSTKY